MPQYTEQQLKGLIRNAKLLGYIDDAQHFQAKLDKLQSAKNEKENS